MFLHSGASYHGHEFSNNQPRATLTTQRRSPLRRAPFSTPNSLSVAIQNSASLLQPERPLSAGEVTPRIKERVSFVEPQREEMSDDGMSYAASEASTRAGSTKKRRRRSSRPSTTFHLAHPAPKLKHKQRLLHIRPQLLLQLQRLSASSRPIPSLDVLPSTTLVPRLSKRFPHMFKGKNGLGANDVVCARSEDYKASLERDEDNSDSDDEIWAHRDIVAVICQMRKDEGGDRGKAGICFSDGSIWEATPVSASIMEFIRTDEMGQKSKARWVRRRDRSSYSPDTPKNEEKDVKFTFSLIDPSSRRHPVIASLTRSTLDIPDQYTALSAAARATSPAFDAIEEDDDSAKEETQERKPHIVDERLKTLIQVTGVWVALKNGWSPNFSYNNQQCPTGLSLNNSSGGTRSRSASVNQDAPRSPNPDTRSSTPESYRESASARIRRTSNHFLHRNSPASPVSPTPTETNFSAPRRSISLGTAFMQRAAARKIVQHPTTIPSDNEGELSIRARNSVTSDLSRFGDGSNTKSPSTSQVQAATGDVSRDVLPAVDGPGARDRRQVQSAIYTSKNDIEVAKQPVTRKRASTESAVPKQALKESLKESRWRRMTSVFRRGHRKTTTL